MTFVCHLAPPPELPHPLRAWKTQSKSSLGLSSSANEAGFKSRSPKGRNEPSGPEEGSASGCAVRLEAQ